MHQQSVIKYVCLSKFQKESEKLREEIEPKNASQRIYSKGNVSQLSLLLAKPYNKTAGDLVKKKLKKLKSSHITAEIFSLISIQKIVLV